MIVVRLRWFAFAIVSMACSETAVGGSATAEAHVPTEVEAAPEAEAEVEVEAVPEAEVEAEVETLAYEEGECRLELGPDRRFTPRVASGEEGAGINHLPAVSADGTRFLTNLAEPYMDEGTYETPPTTFQIRDASDGSLIESVVLATAGENEEDPETILESLAERAREARSKVAGFLSFRRMRGPVRAPLLDESLRKLDELEGPCRREWGIPADATFDIRELGGTPAEDERCSNEVHDIDLHIDLEHRFGLIVLNVGRHVDLCESGLSYHLFRWR